MAESELAVEGGNTNNNEEVRTAKTETKTVTTMVTEDMLNIYPGSKVKPRVGVGAIRNLTNVSSGERKRGIFPGARCPSCNNTMTSYSNEILLLMGKDVTRKMRSSRFIKRVQRTWEKCGLRSPSGKHVCHVCKVTHTSLAQFVTHLKSLPHCFKMCSGIVISSQSVIRDCLSEPSYYCYFCRTFLKDTKRVLKHISLSKHITNVRKHANEN